MAKNPKFEETVVRNQRGEFSEKDKETKPTVQTEAALPYDSEPEETTVDIARRIIEEYELDYNNGEVFEQGDDVYMTVEAPNNATIGVNFDKDSDEQTILREVADYMSDFDADDQFDELWSREFGEHNNFTPSQFINMLQEDEQFFQETAEELYAKARDLERQTRKKLEEKERER